MKDLFSPSHPQQQNQQANTVPSTMASSSMSDVDVSMDDDGHSVNTAGNNNNNHHRNNSNTSGVNTSNDCMSITSPPRTIMRTTNRRSVTAVASTATGKLEASCPGSIRSGRLRSRLFEEDDDEEDDQHRDAPSIHRKPSATLKPLSLNLDLAAEADENDDRHNPTASSSHHRHADLHTTSGNLTTASLSKTPSRPSALRKRSAEQSNLCSKESLSFDREDGDEDVFSAAESPVDMYTSPRISPSSPPSTGSRNSSNTSRMSFYRSPSVPRQGRSSNGGMASHKSPSSFLTLDGRTVQSKNPFSPMIFDEHPTPSSTMDTSTTAHVSSARAKMELRSSPSSPSNNSLFLNMNDASLSIPASLSGRADGNPSSGSSSVEGGRMLLPRHTLHKRDSNHNLNENGAFSMEGLAPMQQQAHQSSLHRQEEQKQKETFYTRDGYPERTGRYSFTGSPIKELAEAPQRSGKSHAAGFPPEMCTNVRKIRRRTKGDDVVAAAAAHVDPCWKQCGMNLHTNNNVSRLDSSNIQDNGDDNISPTDVASFPFFRSTSSDTKTLPPTPSKPVRRPPSKKYTPIRKPTGPPPTPMPPIRRARSFDDDEFGDASESRGFRRHSSGSTMDYLSLSPGGEGGQMQLAAASGPPPSRFYSDFDVISELGNGSFGNVYKVLSRLDGCMYAIKVAHRPAKGMADKDRMLKEVYALAALSDQADTATFHIVRYHQAWMEEQRLYIQTELCTTTLQAEMQQVSPVALSLSRRYKCLREISLALEYIHKNGMVHLDIKPENIFLKNDQFKLGDFGLVSKISAHDVEEGDSRYMSMELLSGDHADLTKSDIFSLGITMYELCMGGSKDLPSNGPEWQSLRSGAVPQLPDTPVVFHNILLAMMHPSYQERPCASELLKRPQLLSDEQKMLMLERNKVLQANLALVAQSKKLEQYAPVPAVPKKGLLARRNTWSFS